jgi:DNA replication and repair protein RecF
LKIQKIKLVNFRNYENQELLLGERTNILYGKNGYGKTNILEGIVLCSIGKSFRNAKDKNMLMSTKDSYKITIEFISNEREQEIVFFYKENNREININGIKVRKIGELIGNIPAVIFSPEDLKIVKGSPIERRRFLDILICQINNKYFYELQKYNKIVTNRNILLKEINKREINNYEMETWNEALIETGSRIIRERVKYINKISEKAIEYQKYLSDEKEKLSIEYINVNSDKQYEEIENLEMYLMKQLNENKKREIKYGATLIGPQRDDLKISLSGLEIKKYGSQGQQRTAVLALKLSELDILKEELDEKPILLLDDVMSELDIERRVRLSELIKDIQVVITTTDIEKNKSKDIKYVKINNGLIQNKLN